MTTVVLVQQGGTGANNAADALGALGAAPIAAYDKANSALEQANAAYSAANNAQVTVYANNSSNVTTQKINFVNTSTITVAVSADGSNANVAFTAVGGAAYDQANAAYAQANLAYSQANNAYGQGNLAYSQANSAYGQANLAYSQANSAYGQANLAYAAANNSNLKSGGLVSGTLNVTQDLIVGGNIYLEGNTTYINVATYSVEDPLIYLASNNSLTDSVDIGFMGAKNTSGTYSHTGFARDATDGKWKLFDGLPEEGHVGNVINFANTYLATLVANVEANTLSVVNGVSGNVNFDSGTLFVDSVNDRVGVGTTTPSYKLHVAGTGYTSGNFTSGGIIETLTTVQSSSGSDLSLNANGVNRDVFFKVNSSTLAMVQGSTGNFGIGTASPTAKLHVYTTTNYTGNLTFDGVASIGPVLNIEAPGNVYTEFRLGSWALTRAKLRVEGYSGAGSGTGGGTLSLWTGDTSGVQQQRLTIDGVGNIGVGTTSPTAKLDVRTAAGSSAQFNLYSGNNSTTTKISIGQIAAIDWDIGLAASTGHFYIGGLGGSVSEAYRIQRTGTSIDSHLWSTGAGTERMRIDSIGNVGIGTTSPDSKLAVYSATGNTQIRFGASSNYYWDISRDNDVTGSLWISNYNAVGSRTNRLVISPDGNVGVGTASPATKFHVSAGAIRLDNGYSFTWAGTGGWNGSTTGSQFFKFTDNNQYYDVYDGAHIFRRASYAESMRITSAGSVGIGTASPSTTLDVNGTITCTTLTETSSIAFKENVDPITDALNFITKLVGVTYDRKDGSAKQKAGLIAEEVEKVLPNLVQKDNDGNAYGIHYTNLIAYLVESIKELNNKIDRLESNR